MSPELSFSLTVLSYREEALRILSETPFFAAWDPAVLKLYVECGTTPDSGGGVRLKTPTIQEALVFTESRTPYEVWEMIENLDERIELRWVVPGKLGDIG